MTRCAVCRRSMVGGYKSGSDRYCSLPCFTASPVAGFCKACLAATSDKAPGGTYTFNTVGTRLFFAADRCPECHSIVQKKAVCALFIPLIPLGKYRVIYVDSKRYIGRRVVAGAPTVPLPITPK